MTATSREIEEEVKGTTAQTTDASKVEALLSGFVRYLEKEGKLAIAKVTILQPGSLIITVECSSLQKLEELWGDYRSGRIDEIAHKFLATEEMVEDLVLLPPVNLITMISEEEYKDCRVHLLQSLCKYESPFHYYTWQIRFLFWVGISSSEIVYQISHGTGMRILLIDDHQCYDR